MRLAIVGSGPAACSCAISLLQQDPSLTIDMYEQGSFSKDKICGDVISSRSLELLNQLGISQLELNKKGFFSKQFKIFQKYDSLEMTKTGFLCVKRKFFDELLRKKAVELGVRFFEKTKVNTINELTDVVELEFRDTLKKKYSYVFVATGVGGSQMKKQKICPSLRKYMKTDKNVDFATNFYFKKNSSSYFWAYPVSRRELNTGIIFFDKQSRDNLLSSYDESLAFYEEKIGLQLSALEAPKFWSVSIMMPLSEELFFKRKILLGETMGTTYNHSGEGIFGALAHGMFCAQEFLNHGEQFHQAQAQAHFKLRTKVFRTKLFR